MLSAEDFSKSLLNPPIILPVEESISTDVLCRFKAFVSGHRPAKENLSNIFIDSSEILLVLWQHFGRYTPKPSSRKEKLKISLKIKEKSRKQKKLWQIYRSVQPILSDSCKTGEMQRDSYYMTRNMLTYNTDLVQWRYIFLSLSHTKTACNTGVR